VIRFDTEAVRGSAELWQQVRSLAPAFQQRGMPVRDAYTFEITTDGRQGFRLGEEYWQIA